MKKIALISTFCDTEEKKNILHENILILKELGIDVIGIGPKTINLPKNIIEEFDYFFYTKDNPLLSWPVKDFSFWKTVWTPEGFVKLQHSVADYGWAALYHVKKLSQIALTFDYDVFYHLIYDVEIDEELLNDIKSDVVNQIHPRRDPNNPEYLWDTTLHFMVFNREMMELIEKEITLENYLSTNGAAEGEVFKWRNKFNIPTSGHPVKDKIYYWGDKDFFNYSLNSKYKMFIGKNSDTTVWVKENEVNVEKKLNSNLRFYFYDFLEPQNIRIQVDGISKNYHLNQNKLIDFEIGSLSISSIILIDNEGDHDYTSIFKEISRNLIYLGA